MRWFGNPPCAGRNNAGKVGVGGIAGWQSGLTTFVGGCMFGGEKVAPTASPSDSQSYELWDASVR